MRTRTLWAALLVYLVTGQPAVAQVDQQRAQEYVTDVQAVCEREGLRLWGVSLCGPMVVADLWTHALRKLNVAEFTITRRGPRTSPDMILIRGNIAAPQQGSSDVIT